MPKCAVLILSFVTLTAACGSSGDGKSYWDGGAADLRESRALDGAAAREGGVVDGARADAAVHCEIARQPDGDCSQGTPAWTCVPDENGGVWTFTCPGLNPDAPSVDARSAADAGGARADASDDVSDEVQRLDADTRVASADAAGGCAKDDDCRVEASYCKACECLALATSASAPACAGRVSCYIDPCRYLSAACRTGRCVTVPR